MNGMTGMTGTNFTALPIRIDFAVLNTQVDTQLVVQDNAKQYVTDLDIIDITEDIFKSIFFNKFLSIYIINFNVFF